ncbi:MAG: family 16 glycoside hydrolase, partial [Planctomycetota bacterium]
MLLSTSAADVSRTHPVRFIVALVIAGFILASTHSRVTAEQWQTLFDGESLAGWKASSGNQQFEVVDGVIRGTSSAKTHFLCTDQQYRDFELELEVKLHDTDLNSGVQIRTATTRVNDNGTVRPNVHGPQVDLGKSPGRSGHVFGQGNRRWFTPKSQLERNSLMVNGEWNRVRVHALGKRIQTWINGEAVGDITLEDELDQKYPKGVIALQVHGVKTPETLRYVSFRNIRIRPLDQKVKSTQANAVRSRMNVLLLVADDLNSWMLGDSNRYSGTVIAPNLRKLARSGTTFAQAYTAAPVCSPSRTAFFSGVAPWRSGH